MATKVPKDVPKVFDAMPVKETSGEFDCCMVAKVSSATSMIEEMT